MNKPRSPEPATPHPARRVAPALYATVLVLLCTYQDLPASRTFGALASSPWVFLAPLLLAVEVVRAKRSAEFVFSPIDRALLLFVGWATTVGLVSILFASAQGRYDYLEESFLSKLLKLQAYYLVPWLVYRHARLVFRIASVEVLTVAFLTTIILHGAVLVVEAIHVPTALGVLHGGEFPYNRIRLLTPEASTAGSVAVVIGLGGLAISLEHRRVLGAVLAAAATLFLISFTLLTQSKGYLALAGISVIGAALSRRRAVSHPALSLGAFALASVIAALLVYRILGSLEETIAATSTVTTRAALAYTAVTSLITRPLGTGFATYEQAIADATSTAIRTVSDHFPTATNFLELDLFQTSSVGLFPKSGLGEAMVFAGVVGLWCAWHAWHHIYQLTRNRAVLRTAALFVLFGLCTYLSAINKYDLVLLVALLERPNAPRLRSNEVALPAGV